MEVFMFIEPKRKYEAPLDIRVSNDALLILKEYSNYTGYDIDELIVKMSEKLLEDAKFISYVQKKRYNKKLMHLISKNKEDKYTEVLIDNEDLPFKD